ncbi:hypothetical protein T484DRAFT_1842294, partial [Baffinella frigidus]
LIAAETSATSILLPWQAPSHGPTPQAYTLRYRYLSTPPSSWSEFPGLQATEFLVGGARSDVLLEAEVCAESLLGGAGCAIKRPAPVFAAAIQPVASLEVLANSTTVTNLDPTKAYIIRAYPKSPAGDFYAPTSPSPPLLQPAAAARNGYRASATQELLNGTATGYSEALYNNNTWLNGTATFF